MSDVVALPRLTYEATHGLEIVFGPIDLDPTERLALFGPNGAGKTTALRLLAGTLGGYSGLPPSAYLPQRPYMFRGAARHNLTLGLDGEERSRAFELADRLGLAPKLADDANGLSGGERQRVALARVLASSAELVLLDEPLSAIDVQDRDSVTAVIGSSLSGRAAVIVTHDREVVATLADRAAVMIGGVIRQLGSVDDVFTLPADDDVAMAVGLGNVLSGFVVGSDDPMVEVDVGGVRIWGFGSQEPGTSVKVLFGAETVTVQTGEGTPTSARNVWFGEIEAIRPVGRLVELVVDVGPRVVALITPGSLEALDLGPGSRVGLTLKATAVHAVSAPER